MPQPHSKHTHTHTHTHTHNGPRVNCVTVPLGPKEGEGSEAVTRWRMRDHWYNANKCEGRKDWSRRLHNLASESHSA